MRKNCNFILPKAFIILSSRALKKNRYVKYIIYPKLKRFKKACLNCPHIKHKEKRFYCLINDKDFMLKFYGIDDRLPKGVYLSLGGVPLDLKTHSLRVRIEAYFNKHAQRPKKIERLRAKNKNLSGCLESEACFSGL